MGHEFARPLGDETLAIVVKNLVFASTCSGGLLRCLEHLPSFPLSSLGHISGEDELWATDDLVDLRGWTLELLLVSENAGYFLNSRLPWVLRVVRSRPRPPGPGFSGDHKQPAKPQVVKLWGVRSAARRRFPRDCKDGAKDGVTRAETSTLDDWSGVLSLGASSSSRWSIMP